MDNYYSDYEMKECYVLKYVEKLNTWNLGRLQEKASKELEKRQKAEESMLHTAIEMIQTSIKTGDRDFKCWLYPAEDYTKSDVTEKLANSLKREIDEGKLFSYDEKIWKIKYKEEKIQQHRGMFVTHGPIVSRYIRFSVCKCEIQEA